MKIALYCQNVLGIGHISRSLNICEELSKEHQVTFIQGGPRIGITLTNSHYHHRYLEPLLMDLEGVLYSPNGLDTHQVFLQRKAELETLSKELFDVVIVEFFPFGRYQFKEEVLTFINRQRALNPKCKVICSMRDIYTIKNNPDKRDKRARYSVETLNKYFDLLLIHSDNSFLSLKESFPYTDLIEIPAMYTGFVAPKKIFKESKGKKEIAVSTGGGSWGDLLLTSVMNVAKNFPQMKFHSFKSAIDTSDLKPTSSNFIVHDFDEAVFKRQMAQSDLSISLAGYNTVVEALVYKTPMLLYPFSFNNEQPLRAEVLKRAGFAHVLNDGRDLEGQITEYLSTFVYSPPSLPLPSLAGTQQTLNIINKLVGL